MTIQKSHIMIEGHAALRLEERSITLAELLRVMNDGEIVARPRPPRFRFHTRLFMAQDNDWLHAVWAVERPRLVVVTVYWENPKTRMGGKR